MKLIFIASLSNPSASGFQRLWALKENKVELYQVNKEMYLSVVPRISGRLGKLLKYPRLLYKRNKLQRHISKVAKTVKPDVIWFEWPQEFNPLFIQSLKGGKHVPYMIAFQDDNPWGDRDRDRWMWKDYFKIIPEFDLHLVKRPQDIVNLTAWGARKCRLWQHGIYTPLFYPVATEKKYDVSFVGTCMDTRADLIEFLLEQKVQVHIFGNKWKQRTDLPNRFPENFHPAVEGRAYADVIRKSSICLGLVSQSNKDEWTMRTFEVPGCATLLLAEHTPYHETIFAEDKNMLLFSGKDDCLNKIRVLLSKPGLCAEKAAAISEDLYLKKHTIQQRMNELLAELKIELDKCGN